MITLDGQDRTLIATALDTYIAYCADEASGTGDLADVALEELRPIRAWWGRVITGTASETESDPELRAALHEPKIKVLNHQVRAWIHTALDFYTRYCRGQARIGGRRDDGVAIAARSLDDLWYAEFFGPR